MGIGRNYQNIISRLPTQVHIVKLLRSMSVEPQKVQQSTALRHVAGSSREQLYWNS